MTDEALIAGFLEGDAAAAGRIRGWIRAAATPYRARLDASLEDLEQEILLDLTTTLRNQAFAGRSQLETYVRRAVHYKCIDRLRSDRRRTIVDIATLELVSPAPSAFDELSRNEATHLALKVVEEMPETCRQLWAMIEEGLSYGEMSQRVGLREGALRARVHRCRQRALELRAKILAQTVAGGGHRGCAEDVIESGRPRARAARGEWA